MPAMIDPIPDPVHEGSLDLAAPELYLNRELSLLQFFRRVLALAAQPDMPVLERLRFLTICSTITDEFFEIRVAGLKQRSQLDVSRPAPDGLPSADVLRRISELVHDLVAEQYRLLNHAVLPTLSAAGIQLVPRSVWTKNQRKWVKRYFDTQVAPVLTPVGLDPAHPFPRIINKSLNMLVSLEGRDAFGRSARRAVLQVPRCLPRVIQLPAEAGADEPTFVLLSSIVHAHIEEAFPGMKVRGCHQFRVTRNADLWVDEEEVEDLLGALQDHLHDRRFGHAVRLEVVDSCPEEEIAFLLEHFELTAAELYRVDGPVNLHRIIAVYDLVERPELKFQPFVPGLRGATGDLFAALDAGDILLHHPYESFVPVVELMRQAAQDPEVLAIKQTLYRVGSRSLLVEALIEAALAGKEVTAVVELRARFDEAANIDLATRLQQAGAHVVYGVVGYKTHAKMMLVVRREGDKLKRYVHLGTGNYHAGTARSYTDWSLMTAREAVADDVHRIFMQLTGLGRAKTLSLLFQAPFTLQTRLAELIAFEAQEARAGRPARIVFKINSLSDPAMIQALYQASQAGVSVDLIVRGVCCLRPGLPGISQNIRVRSVVGRFLEHTRVFWFHAAGEDKIYLSSADLMGRNLYRRVETCFPVLDQRLRKRVIDEGLKRYLDDTEGAWVLDADGTYRACAGTGPVPRSAQGELLVLLAER